MPAYKSVLIYGLIKKLFLKGQFETCIAGYIRGSIPDYLFKNV